jgi:hypothetical protein
LARFKFKEQVGITENSIFDHFGHPRSEFSNREGVQGCWIDQDQMRLMKSADQIFAARVIHPCLPSNGGIHHCQQCCWNLNDADTSQPRCCGKSGHVSHDPTAKG